MLNAHLAASTASASPASLNFETGTPGLIDDAVLETRFAGDFDFFREMGELFLEIWPEMFRDLEEQCGQEDGVAVSRAAHKLKGSIGVFTMHEPYLLCQQIEQLAREANISNAIARVQALADSLVRLENEIRDRCSL